METRSVYYDGYKYVLNLCQIGQMSVQNILWSRKGPVNSNLQQGWNFRSYQQLDFSQTEKMSNGNGNGVNVLPWLRQSQKSWLVWNSNFSISHK